MNFAATQVVLDAISDVCDLRNISITTENTDWQGKPYHSDYVTLDAEHKIGFEVFENEIIAFYFGDHCHFEDYTSELEEDDTPYIQRAIAFFRRFFTTPLQLLEKRKGKQRLRSEWFFLLPDGRKESIAGPWIIWLFSNPFVKPKIELKNWHYCKPLGRFLPSEGSDIIVQTIEYDWDILIEIHKRNGMYTYTIDQNLYDDNDGWFWIQVDRGCSLFAAEEKAVQAAKEEAKAIKDRS